VSQIDFFFTPHRKHFYSGGRTFAACLLRAPRFTFFLTPHNEKILQRRPHICRMSPESAEIGKLCSNCFRTTKIRSLSQMRPIRDL